MSAVPQKYPNDEVDRPSAPPTTAVSIAERRRVVFATVIGTTVEWYDYFIYAAAAGLVFSEIFFEPAGAGLAPILSFATVGISFLFRPLGALVAGHLGDKYGRRLVLMITLMMMGAATMLIGLLPTYAAIGIAAPILLILLRILQGISAGGEWGGSVLLAVEHAPVNKRGLFGAGPQMGVPLGLLLASGMMAIMAVIAPGDAFVRWGWRVPFLFSFVLILVGHYVRRRVEESPVFVELSERKALTKTSTKSPILQLLRRHAPLVIVAALVFAGNSAVGYMTTGGYIQRYATDVNGAIALPRALVLWAVAVSGLVWLVATLLAGLVSDRIGRRGAYLIGWGLQLAGVLALFPLVNTGRIEMLGAGLAFLALGLGFTYGPQAALYTELFPASIRFSGVSISYAIGSILGGAFAPMIAEALVNATGTTQSVTWYLVGMTGVGLLATLALRDRSGIPLGPDHEAEQSVSPIRWLSKA